MDLQTPTYPPNDYMYLYIHSKAELIEPLPDNKRSKQRSN